MKDWSVSKLVSVVLGSYNRLGFLKITVGSIRLELKKMESDNEIIVVDGGSSDGSLEWLSKQKDIMTIIQHNRGKWDDEEIKRRSWGYFMNLGFKSAKGKYVCMVSDDCVLMSNCIKNGVDLFESRLKMGEKVGAVAFYFRNWPEQEKFSVGLTLGGKMLVNHGLFLNEALKSVDYIDEDSYFFYHADGDLILKIWEKGYVCIDSPTSLVEHYSHANYGIRATNGINQKNDWEMYVKKWKGKFICGHKDDNLGGEKSLDDVQLSEKNVFVEEMRKYHLKNKFRILTVDLLNKIRGKILK